jgi:hypothetical protein
MDTEPDRDRPDFYVSTGHLPPPDRVKTLVEEAYEQFKSNRRAGHRQFILPSQTHGKTCSACVLLELTEDSTRRGTQDTNSRS